MKKTGVICLFSTCFQLIITVLAYEFYWVYRMTNGGVGGTVIDQINPLIWYVLLFELIVSVILILGNFNSCNNEKNSKSTA